jgi:uncharacterized surface protein with fasciclin (FAS1) repeats
MVFNAGALLIAKPLLFNGAEYLMVFFYTSACRSSITEMLHEPFYAGNVYTLQNIRFMKKKLFSFLLLPAMAAMVLVACDQKKEDKQADAGDKAATENTTTGAGTETPPPPPPPPPQTVVDIAVGSADHSTLVAAVKAAGLDSVLMGAGPFTIFAPTNAAFEKLPKGTVEGLLKPEKKADLAAILTYHVVAGSMKAADLKDGMMLKTVNGKELKVTLKDGKAMVNGAVVTAADLTGSNGVIHVIDAVVLPK